MACLTTYQTFYNSKNLTMSIFTFKYFTVGAQLVYIPDTGNLQNKHFRGDFTPQLTTFWSESHLLVSNIKNTFMCVDSPIMFQLQTIAVL